MSDEPYNSDESYVLAYRESEARVAELEAERTLHQQKIVELEAEVEHYQTCLENARTRERVDRDRRLDLEAEVEKLRVKNTGLASGLDNYIAELGEAEAEIEGLKAANENYRKQIVELEAKLAEVEKELAGVDEYNGRLLGSIERAGELAREIWEDPTLTGAPAHKAREIARLLSGKAEEETT